MAAATAATALPIMDHCSEETPLIEKYGKDTVLPDLLALLASDCDFRNKLGNQRCGAIYPALGLVKKRNELTFT